MAVIRIEQTEGGFQYVRLSNHHKEWFWRMVLCQFDGTDFVPVVIPSYEGAVEQYTALEVYCAPKDPGIYGVETESLWFLSQKILEVGWCKHVESVLLREELEQKARERLAFVQKHGIVPEQWFCRCGAEPMPSKVSVLIQDPMNDRYEGSRSFCPKCWRKYRRLEARMRDVRESRKFLKQMKEFLNDKQTQDHG